MKNRRLWNVKGQGQGQGGSGLGFFYFILNSPPLIRNVTCSVTLRGREIYEVAMSDEHPPEYENKNRSEILSGNSKKVKKQKFRKHFYVIGLQ